MAFSQNIDVVVVENAVRASSTVWSPVWSPLRYDVTKASVCCVGLAVPGTYRLTARSSPATTGPAIGSLTTSPPGGMVTLLPP